MAALLWGARPTTTVAWPALSPFSGISTFVRISAREHAPVWFHANWARTVGPRIVGPNTVGLQTVGPEPNCPGPDCLVPNLPRTASIKSGA